MSGRYAIDGDTLTGIAGAIRTKLGVQTQYTPAQMAAAIGTISGNPVLQEKTATQNGEVTPDSGYDGLSKVTVNVSGVNTYYIYSNASTGAYIDTGVPCNTENLKVVGQFKYSVFNDRCIFGGTWATNGFLLLVYSNSLRWHSKGVTLDIPASETNTGIFSAENTIECTKDYIKINGHEHQTPGSRANVSDNLKIFGFRDGYSADVGFSSLQLYQGDTLLRDFVPDLQNGAACFVDRVSGQYYFNAGSGNLYYA